MKTPRRVSWILCVALGACQSTPREDATQAAPEAKSTSRAPGEGFGSLGDPERPSGGSVDGASTARRGEAGPSDASERAHESLAAIARTQALEGPRRGVVARSLLESARQAYAVGRYREARDLLDRVDEISSDPAMAEEVRDLRDRIDAVLGIGGARTRLRVLAEEDEVRAERTRVVVASLIDEGESRLAAGDVERASRLFTRALDMLRLAR